MKKRRRINKKGIAVSCLATHIKMPECHTEAP